MIHFHTKSQEVDCCDTLYWLFHSNVKTLSTVGHCLSVLQYSTKLGKYQHTLFTVIHSSSLISFPSRFVHNNKERHTN